MGARVVGHLELHAALQETLATMRAKLIPRFCTATTRILGHYVLHIRIPEVSPT